MIILNDKNYPYFIVLIVQPKYDDLEFKTLKSNLEYINKRTIKDKCYINLHVDLYNMETYSSQALSDTISYLNGKSEFSYFNSVKIYMNKNNIGFITRAALHLASYTQKIKIELIELDSPKNW